MALSITVEPIDRDIAVFLGELSGPLRSRALAEFAEQEIEEAKKFNASLLGQVPQFKIFVDGVPSTDLTRVKPDGVIVAEFEIVTDALDWIGQQLVLHSPVLTGRYQDSHVLLADGLEVDPNSPRIPDAEEYVFVNKQPYARMLEQGSSSQAPDGVYQAVAILARRRFKGVGRITFSYRTIFGGERNPAIVIISRTK